MSHQALRKSHGSDNHCTECCVTCWKCCMKKNIRNNKTDLKKKEKKKKEKNVMSLPVTPLPQMITGLCPYTTSMSSTFMFAWGNTCWSNSWHSNGNLWCSLDCWLICEYIIYVINVHVCLEETRVGQIVGVPMETNGAPLNDDLFTTSTWSISSTIMFAWGTTYWSNCCHSNEN